MHELSLDISFADHSAVVQDRSLPVEHEGGRGRFGGNAQHVRGVDGPVAKLCRNMCVSLHIPEKKITHMLGPQTRSFEATRPSLG